MLCENIWFASWLFTLGEQCVKIMVLFMQVPDLDGDIVELAFAPYTGRKNLEKRG